MRSKAANLECRAEQCQVAGGRGLPGRAAIMPRPSAADAPDSTKMNGISGYPSCRPATAVSLISAAV
jgi:hypothetical protein